MKTYCSLEETFRKITTTNNQAKTKRKFLQNTYLLKDSNPEYTKKSCNLVIEKTQRPIFLSSGEGRRFEQMLCQRRKINGKLSTQKDAQHHWPSGKCKLKPQGDSIIYPSTWLKFKRLTIPRGDKDAEQLGITRMAVGNAKWYSHVGKQSR